MYTYATYILLFAIGLSFSGRVFLMAVLKVSQPARAAKLELGEVQRALGDAAVAVAAAATLNPLP